ncbi:hypothetical protein QUB52_14870 [Microcoleus sp. A6-C6]
MALLGMVCYNLQYIWCVGEWGIGRVGEWGSAGVGEWEKSSRLTSRLNIDRVNPLNPLNPLDNSLPNFLESDRPRQSYRTRLR